jgi:type IV pilus assembly protein PilY1
MSVGSALPCWHWATLLRGLAALLPGLAAPAWVWALQETSLLWREPGARPDALTLVLVVDTRGSDPSTLPALKATARLLIEAQPAGRAALVHQDAGGRLAVHDPVPLAEAQPALLAAIDALTPDAGLAIEDALHAAAALAATAGTCAAVQPLLVSANRPSRRLLALLPGLQWVPAGALTDASTARALLLAPVPRPDAPQLLAAPLPPAPSGQPPRHADAVYLGLFEASGREAWPGNLHRFRRSGTRIVDGAGQEVLDPAGPRLRPGVAGDWSDSANAGRAMSGGAADRLPAAADRRIWSNLAGLDLAATGNAVHADNPLALAALDPLSPDQARAVIGYLRDGEASGLGDPLHGSPVLLPGAGGEDGLVFLATNAGLLHAIAAASGREQWAFIPARLLPRLALLRDNPPAPAGRSHGLDGGLRLAWPAAPGAPRTVLIAAMRRGGDGLYALDVSMPDHPRLLWALDASSPGFSALGESWSLPVPARIRAGGTIRDVAVFGGGHDASQDLGEPGPSPRGNALYVIDLVTGELLASAGAGPGHALALPAMRYAIPATPRVVDLDQDGLADRIYVGDTGGQLWRLDVASSADRLLTAGVLAELGSTAAPGDPAAARRFYATPDVVAVTSADGLPVLQIQLGSGHYPRLLDQTVTDMFFAVRDQVPPGRLADPARRPAGLGDLADVGDGAPPDVAGGTAGWRLALAGQPGEKVLQPALSLNGRVYFSSFAPGRSASCDEPIGQNRLYELGLRDGRPPRAAADEALEAGQPPARARLLEQSGIAPGPSLLWPAGAPAMVCAGIECRPGDPALEAPRRSWWRWSRLP